MELRVKLVFVALYLGGAACAFVAGWQYSKVFNSTVSAPTQAPIQAPTQAPANGKTPQYLRSVVV